MHKKECKKRAAELYDEKLFKEIELEECPICFQPVPQASQSKFMTCCGKVICNGCMYVMKMSEGKDLCPYCRTPPPSSDEENINRIKKLMDRGNAKAFNQLAAGYYHDEGTEGLPYDLDKANELYLKAGELGCASGYHNLGQAYREGTGVVVDMGKAKYYYELSAMGGHVRARHNLGVTEATAGNWERAFKHFIIAARAGYKASLDVVKEGYIRAFVTKDEYASTMRAYHERHEEIKSDSRDKAAASGF